MNKPFLRVNIKQFDEGVTFDAVKAYLEANADNAEVQNYLAVKVLTSDKVKGFLDTEEGKKLLQPRLDANFSKGLETWKTNNLTKLIDDEVAKRNPTKTPEQIELDKLRKEIEDERNARNREALVNKALKVAKEKNLPDSIVDFFIGQDEETTLTNLTKLEEEYSKAVTSAVDSKFKEHGRHIDQGDDKNNTTIDIASLAAEASIRQ